MHYRVLQNLKKREARTVLHSLYGIQSLHCWGYSYVMWLTLYLASVMIYHRGARLSKQHTDLLIVIAHNRNYRLRTVNDMRLRVPKILQNPVAWNVYNSHVDHSMNSSWQPRDRSISFEVTVAIVFVITVKPSCSKCTIVIRWSFDNDCGLIEVASYNGAWATLIITNLLHNEFLQSYTAPS